MRASLLFALVLAACNSAAADTTFETPAFSITLPGTWADNSDADTISYRNESGTDQITIGVFPFKKETTLEERRETLKRVDAHYRTAEKEVAGSSAGATTLTEWRGMLRSDFSGAEGRRTFSRTTVATPKAILSFYYESLEYSGQAYEKRATSIVNGLSIK